ncbi:MAG: hypothetical protein LBQ81_14270 [Zoogloeaceae bacterium]|nr:hypothetical protein [Zoogloeaceae bacterium]
MDSPGDKISFANWFASTAYQVEEFKLDDGSLLQNTRIQELVNAMKDYTPPIYEEAGQTPVDYPEELLQLIGVQWEAGESSGEVLL